MAHAVFLAIYMCHGRPGLGLPRVEALNVGISRPLQPRILLRRHVAGSAGRHVFVLPAHHHLLALAPSAGNAQRKPSGAANGRRGERGGAGVGLRAAAMCRGGRGGSSAGRGLAASAPAAPSPPDLSAVMQPAPGRPGAGAVRCAASRGPRERKKEGDAGRPLRTPAAASALRRDEADLVRMGYEREDLPKRTTLEVARQPCHKHDLAVVVHSPAAGKVGEGGKVVVRARGAGGGVGGRRLCAWGHGKQSEGRAAARPCRRPLLGTPAPKGSSALGRAWSGEGPPRPHPPRPVLCMQCALRASCKTRPGPGRTALRRWPRHPACPRLPHRRRRGESPPASLPPGSCGGEGGRTRAQAGVAGMSTRTRAPCAGRRLRAAGLAKGVAAGKLTVRPCRGVW